MSIHSNIIRSTVISEIELVAKLHDRTLAPLTDDAALVHLGLDSLCMAVLVVRLQDSLGVDPFTAAGDMELPVTLGDFVRAYEGVGR